MTICKPRHRNLLTETGWLLLISLFCLSGRCSGQTCDGFGYSVSGTNITITGYTGSGAVTIPSSIPGVDGTVTSIRWGAFCGRTDLTGVTIPASVTSIGDYAFCQCSNLTSVTIPGRVTYIGNMAFEWCTRLTSITFSDGVTSIGDGAFEDCPGLTSVTIPSSVTSIGDGAFAECSGLTSVAIPSGVTSIWNAAFWRCVGLTSVYSQGNAPPTFGFEVFDGAAPGFSIYYPSTASGWSTPTWNGYRAQPYNYTPAGQKPLLNVIRGPGAVTPSFNGLVVGTNYQLQVSTDLSTWTNAGPVFTATNSSEAYAQPFDVTNGNRLFFRLQSAQ